MERIGIRELRQNASVYLERVKEGESIEITERGVPIAVLSPVAGMSRYERLVAEGKIIPARSNLADFLRNHPVADREPSEIPLSVVLQQMRDEEYE